MNHITGELSFRFNSRTKRSGISRLPSGSGLARALLQVLKIASDCSEELCRVGGTSTPATHPATGRRQRQSPEAGAAWKEGGISWVSRELQSRCGCCTGPVEAPRRQGALDKHRSVPSPPCTPVPQCKHWRAARLTC